MDASIGVKRVIRPGHDTDDLIEKADITLYMAQADGRGVSRLLESGMEQSAQVSQALRVDPHEALSRGEFTLHYQPVVQISTGLVAAFWALLHWQHLRIRLVSLVEFIPMAESTCAIVTLRTWVLQEACRQAMA